MADLLNKEILNLEEKLSFYLEIFESEVTLAVQDGRIPGIHFRYREG